MSSFEHTSTESQSAIPSALRAYYADTNDAIRQVHPQQSGYSDHTRRSRAKITRDAEAALHRAPKNAPKTALMLGAGNCLDIPLKYLAKHFDHTWLVDVDTAACKRALQALPAPHLGKVSLLGADVTGMIGDFGKGLERIGQQRPDSDTLQGAISGLLKTTMQTTTQPDLGTNYTFVSSHLLLSQLTALPLSFLCQHLQEHHPSLAANIETATGTIGGEIKTFLDHTQGSHIAQLAGLVANKGMVHLADTFYEITPSGLSSRMINPEVIIPAVLQHFDPVYTEAWNWQLDQGSFHVAAHSLQPKLG